MSEDPLRVWIGGRRFAGGIPDGLHDEIGQTHLGRKRYCLRAEGLWVQRALFALDQRPILLQLENARSGLIWKLMAKNPNIQLALDRLRGRI